ncbi:hypothetical protein R1flu_002028 [Riccia fluitans]|uniref:Uncharacterized protein n=1 Tax=Riccia fluitans TaxID=41844 RepID=A0ABD1Y4Y6_9MARC
MARFKDALQSEKNDNKSLATQLTNLCSRYENLKANLEEGDMTHLIETSEHTMADTKDANDDEGGHAFKDSATSEHPSNIPRKRDDDDAGGGSACITQTSKSAPKITRSQ